MLVRAVRYFGSLGPGTVCVGSAGLSMAGVLARVFGDDSDKWRVAAVVMFAPPLLWMLVRWVIERGRRTEMEESP